MLKDAFLPPPFGDTRATWIINGGVYHEKADARLAAREAGLSVTDAEDYVRMLYAEYVHRHGHHRGAAGREQHQEDSNP